MQGGEKYRTYKPELVSPPFGLNNTGAICWFNSVTQFLLGIPAMSEVMLEKQDELTHNGLAAEYISALKGLLPTGPDVQPIEPSIFAGLSARLLHAMTAGGALSHGQQCAAEGFTTFLGAISSNDIDGLFDNAYRQTIKCGRCSREVSSVRDTSNRINVPPTKSFASVESHSQWRVYTSGLPLNHPHRSIIKNFNSTSEFQTWLMHHSALTLDFTCPQCNFKMPVVNRGEALSMLREVIVVSFDMFNRADPTWFPQTMVFPSNDGTTLKYELCGKICWSGSINRLPDGRVASGGHYWAHSLREGQWYCLNDGSVSPGDPKPDSSTFMIAYHLVK